MEEQEVEKITGTLKKQLYPKDKNDDSFFKVIVIETEKGQPVTVVGNMNVMKKYLYTFTGKYITNKYGTSFKISIPPEPYIEKCKDRDSVIDYLSSRLFEGIGPKKAELIYDYYGDKAQDIVENHPEELVGKIKGITDLTVESIKSSFNRNYRYRDLLIALKGKGVSDHMINLILDRYGGSAVSIIKNNPYRIAYDIKGFGFKTADKISLSYDDSRYHSVERIQAAIIYVMRNVSSSKGDLYTDFNTIERETRKELDFNPKEYGEVTFYEFKNAICDLISEGEIIVRYGNDCDSNYMEAQYYLASYYYSERNAVISLVDHLKAGNDIYISVEDVEMEIKRIEKRNKVKYSSEQKSAIVKALTRNISVITGGPGTGKTFVINAVKEIFSRLAVNSGKVVLCAPTGKAANRMSSITGEKAFTIHRLLEVDGKTGKFKRNANNPIEASLLIIDEASMIGLSLFRNLIEATPIGTCRIVIVGDVDQLPSVDPGNVLSDIIMSSKIPETVLTSIYRQKKQSNIIRNAQAINAAGKGKVLGLNMGTDFEILKVTSNVDEKWVAQQIFDKYSQELKSYNEVQVLTPTREKGIVSVAGLNKGLESIANSRNKNNIVLSDRNGSFRIGDRVMRMRNDYEKNVFNGETGIITGVRKEGNIRYIVIDFGDGRSVCYRNSEEFVLSYATTIHKSQGSEYDCVIVPILSTNQFSLSKKLIYTAITRGKKKVDLIVCPKALTGALENRNFHERKTNMEIDIRKYYNTGHLQINDDGVGESMKIRRRTERPDDISELPLSSEKAAECLCQ